MTMLLVTGASSGCKHPRMLAAVLPGVYLGFFIQPAFLGSSSVRRQLAATYSQQNHVLVAST